MEWHISGPVIDGLFVDGANIVNPWGIETSDSSGFFTLEKGKGYRYTVLQEEYSFGEKHFDSGLTVQMPEGRWRLALHDAMTSDSTVERKAELKCEEDSHFLDFVMRFRFKKELTEYAEINRVKVYHHNSYVYHQHPVGEVLLVRRNDAIRIRCKKAILPDKMKLVTYVSDQKGEWVVHMRALPAQVDKEVIKLCNAWFKTRPLPQGIAKVLLRSDRLKRALWYRGERSPYKSLVMRRLINPVAFPLVSISKGSQILIEAEVELEQR